MQLTISGQPITKKNSQQVICRGNIPRLLPSKAFRDYERAALLNWGLRLGKCAVTGKRKPFPFPGSQPPPTITGPVQLIARYWLQDRRRTPDLLNLLAATSDILEAAGIVPNDKDIVSVDGSRIVGLDRDNPRVEIELIQIR